MREKLIKCSDAIALLILFIVVIGSAIFLIKWSQETFTECVVDNFKDKKCYDYNKNQYMELHFTINNNRTAFINCGPVFECNRDLCNINITDGKTYNCKLYDDTGLYVLNESPTFTYALFSLLLFIGLYLLYSLIHMLENNNESVV